MSTPPPPSHNNTLPRAALRMSPHFSERPWGGTMLSGRLGKSVPPGGPFGEAWEMSDHPNGRSTIATGEFAGLTFGELVARFPREMIGVPSAPARHPLLVKIIDAAEDLSIQVHPNDEQAAASGDRGKTECWYVMDCAPGTEVIFGLRPGATPQQLRTGAVDGSLGEHVSRHPLSPGDFLFVRAGTVHAILGGTLICEIQQSSDTTYRLWDWNRQPPRPLHVEESIAVIDWSAVGVAPCQVGEVGSLIAPALLTENEFFVVRALDIPPDALVDLPADESRSGRIVVAVAGAAELLLPEGATALGMGETAFIPACCAGGAAQARNPGDTAARLLVAESRELGLQSPRA